MRQSDEDRFAGFVRAHGASLFRTAFLLTGDYQRAEDLLQSTWVHLYRRWPQVEKMARPVAYTRKVLVNQSISWWRRRSSHEVLLVVQEEPSWGGRVDEIPEHQRVWQAVLQLPPRQRAVIVLKYYEDLSEAEIADALEMAVGTVKSHAHAATRRLSDLLSEPSAPSARHPEEATS